MTTTPQQTPLARRLTEKIAQGGPMPVSAFMALCLSDPDDGYYVQKPVIGAAGDFTTAPEISQTFGELIGLWCAAVWQSMGAPERVNLVELGPGRGTLMKDALRAARRVPEFAMAAHVHLVEINPHLIEHQTARLADCGSPRHWHRDAAAIPPGPVIVVANEFLDTLPIDQWQWDVDGWRVRQVGLDADGELAFVLRPSRHGPVLPPDTTASPGAIFETRNVGALTGWLNRTAAAAPTAGLFIDYGHPRTAAGDTLQAVRNHRFVSPLASPGDADLSAQVDFGALSTAMRDLAGLAVDGPVTQAEFLGRLGIAERGSRLMAANPLRAGTIEAGIARLMAPGGMGGRFLALGVRSPGVPPLPAFPAVDSQKPAA